MKRLLLLASSAIDAAHADEARRLGLASVEALGTGDVLLLRKDAFAEHAARQGFTRVAFALAGRRVEDGLVTEKAWYPTDQIAPYEHVSWPLYRDRKLAEAARKALDAGWSVEALVVHDGARDVVHEHLVRVCHEHGLPTRVVRPGVAAPVAQPASGEAESEFDIVFVDTETTGLSRRLNAVVQIGALHCDRHGRTVRREFKILMKPHEGAVVDKGALAVNGLSPSDWKDAPDAREGYERFLAWLPKRFVFGGHNAAFDRGMLEAGIARAGLAPPGWHGEDVCTKKRGQTLVKDGVVRDAKLATLCEHFGISNENAHDALVDIRRTQLVHVAMDDAEAREDTANESTGTDD